MKTYELSARQICFILIAYNVTSKLLLYPDDLAAVSGNDLLFSALIDFAFQLAAVWSAAFLCSKTDMTLFELIENTIGRVGSMIVAGLFALFFALAALCPILENKLYVHSVFYDTVPPLAVFLPFFVFSVYVGAKNLRNAARCADVCFPLFIAAIALVFALSFGQAEWDRLLPILRTPIKNIGFGAMSTLHYFSGGAFMLMFVGRFKYNKGDCTKITLSYALGGALTLAFLALFYGVFGGTAQNELFAVSKVAVYFPLSATLGRIDFIALYALEIVCLFYIALHIQLCREALSYCLNVKSRAALSVGINIVLLILVIALENYFSGTAAVYAKWLWIAYAVFSLLCPALVWLLRRERI